MEFFSLLLLSCRNGESVCLDRSEKYEKQSYRNRFRILSANGPLDLNFPIIHNGRYGICEVEVDYSTPWVHKTEYAVESAYCNSPFFIYYRDELFSILDSHPERLWELNFKVMDFFCRKIGISPTFSDVPSGRDYRGLIHPKKTPLAVNPPYWQVFRDRFGFVANLSVADLLFNEGPESLSFLRVDDFSK